MKKVTFTIILIWAFCLSAFAFASPDDLSGEWELTVLNGESVSASVPITINFISDQSVAEGFSGCSQYNTFYYVIGADGIQFGTIATRPLESPTIPPECSDVINTETAYFDALVLSSAWSQDGELLLLQDGSGADLLQFSNSNSVTVPLSVTLNNVVAESETMLLIGLAVVVGLSTLSLSLIKKRSMR